MEIQDRNGLLQMLNIAKESKPQLSFNENSFVEVLNSSKAEVFVSPKDTKDVEFKQVAKQSASLNTKDIEKKSFDVNKDVSKKADVKETVRQKPKNENKKVKEEVKEENAVAANQVSNNVVEDAPVQDTGSEEVVSSDIVETSDEVVSLENATTNISSTVAIEGVEAEVLQTLLQTEVVAVDNVVAPEKILPVMNEMNKLVVSEVEKEASESLNVVSDDAAQVVETAALISEEDASLIKQAKYFDEKVATDKKIKFEVNITEEKIAEPVVKDVLKNRFEIDSMFQSVDEAVQTQGAEVGLVSKDVQNVAEDTKILPEIKNSIYAEIRNTQEVVKVAVAKDTSITAVSGKEVVAEVANISKNETFAKINETSSRDSYKGISKDVIEQIKVNITKSAIKGVDTIDIQLKPEDLGKVQIKMHIARDGKIQADIIASRAETADMLQKDASALSKAFNDAGYDTDAKSFTFSFQNENQAKGQEKDNTGLLKFIGESLEQESENIAGNDNLGYDPILGLNIRV